MDEFVGEIVTISEPIATLNRWILEEAQKGVPNPKQAVLSSSTEHGIPHARVVSIREISEMGLIFFTQKNTRKVSELHKNPASVLTFWFEFYERQVIIEGKIKSLSDDKIKEFWESNSREAQIEFHIYSPTYSTAVTTKQELGDRKRKLKNKYDGTSIPLSKSLCGFCLVPDKYLFYDCSPDSLSEIFDYVRTNDKWQKQLLAPYTTSRIIDE